MEPVTIEITGPIFNGQAQQAAHELTQAIVDRVANYALEQVQHNLDGSLKNPTPYYETQINVAGYMTDRVVNDRGVVYGPWLENGSSRRATRFKGYASFRRAHQATVAKVQQLADGVVRQFIGRLGG
jgi:hypothetical protein